MKREIIITKDGSTTIHLPELNEQYHSVHGAIQEAYHVFIKNGLLQLENKKNLAILELGFGTGLNCFITFLEAQKQMLQIEYVGVEAYPILSNELQQLNYLSQLNAKAYAQTFDDLHKHSWNVQRQLSNQFFLTKRKQFFSEINDTDSYDLIYFDAFGPRVQPELWTAKIFQKMFNALRNNGILVTYSAKGSVRRAMQQVGFTVERLPGPPGKREMLRATKL